MKKAMCKTFVEKELDHQICGGMKGVILIVQVLSISAIWRC